MIPAFFLPLLPPVFPRGYDATDWSFSFGSSFATTGTIYDAKKVENLRKKLLETLKHAANIRSLQPEASVAMAVVGPAHTEPSRVILSLETTGGIIVTDRELRTNLQETVLTIRTKKADVDAFAEGKLSFEEFRQRATILAY